MPSPSGEQHGAMLYILMYLLFTSEHMIDRCFTTDLSSLHFTKICHKVVYIVTHCSCLYLGIVMYHSNWSKS